MRDCIVVVQARAGSSRFPSKVLADLAGRPMLRFMLDRLADVGADELIVATSDRSTDDPVVQVAGDAGVAVVRGPEDDVLARYGLALDDYPAHSVVRLTADCPLIDAELVAHSIRLHAESGVDYLSNTLVRTYPDGLDTEVITSTALKVAVAESRDPFEREHVTPFVYRRPERFDLGAVSSHEPLELHRWTVDWPEDLDRIRGLVEGVADPIRCGWRDFLSVAEEPETGDGVLRTALVEDLGSRTSTGLIGLTSDALRMVEELDGSALEDPARRVWVVRRIEGIDAWVRLTVDDCVGRLNIAVGRSGEEARLVELIEASCAVARGQAHEVRVDPADERSLALFEHAGFRLEAASGDYLRDLHSA